MTSVRVETTFGAVPVWRVREASDATRPVIFVVRGAFAERDSLEDLAIAGAEVVLVHLPGFHSVVLRPLSVVTFAAAYDQVVDQLFPDRDVLLLGLSLGALAAMAMRAPQVRGQVLVEPFLSTSGLWPLIEWLQENLAAFPDKLKARWLESIFGVSQHGVQDRDYSSLVSLRVPTWVLAGNVPLAPRRPVPKLTSLTSEADRSTFREAGAILRIAQSGHDVPGDDRPALLSAIDESLVTLDLRSRGLRSLGPK